MTRYPVRYRPPSRYLRYRGHGRSSNTEMWVAVAIGVAVLGSAGTGTAVTVTHHHAQHRHAAAPHAPARIAPVTSGSERAFIAATLSDLGAPATSADIYSLAAWFTREFPAWPPYAANNPMSSTQPMPGSTVYNGVGVQDYPTASEGAQATALTLANGHYPLIVAALKSGTGLCGRPDLAAEFLVWSGDGYSGAC